MATTRLIRVQSVFNPWPCTVFGLRLGRAVPTAQCPLSTASSKNLQCTVVYRCGNFVEKVPFSATFEDREIALKPADHATEVVL